MIQVPFAPFNDSFWCYQHLCSKTWFFLFINCTSNRSVIESFDWFAGFLAEFFHHMKEQPKPQSDSQTDDRTVVAYCYPEKTTTANRKLIQCTDRDRNESRRFMDANSTHFVLVNKSYWNTNSLQLLSFLCDATAQMDSIEFLPMGNHLFPTSSLYQTEELQVTSWIQTQDNITF